MRSPGREAEAGRRGGGALGPLARLGRFGVVGLVATAVHVAVGLALHHRAGATPLAANAVAFSVAVIVSFAGQRRLTFPDAAADGATFLRFVAAALAGLGLNQLIVWAVTGPGGGPYWLALVLVLASVPAVVYSLLRYWTFRP